MTPGNLVALKSIAVAAAFAGLSGVGSVQIDHALAAQYFREARAICERDNGQLWGISLCGPMAIADAATNTIATNGPAPSAPRPAAFGFANAALNWGDTRWSTFAWPLIPASDAHRRAVLWMHELFHRVQPQLGLLVPDGPTDHLDTAEGRYYMRLEWRALSKALAARAGDRAAALADVAAFRSARRAAFAGSSESERVLEINEGLAQYTGTVLAVTTTEDAITDAIAQLRRAEDAPTFVRTFPYPSGAAYGLLLDAASPGWRKRIKATDDLGRLVVEAAAVTPARDIDAAAQRYDGPALKRAEDNRTRERQALIDGLRKRFVDGPVLVVPRSNNMSNVTAGQVPIPGAGTIFSTLRATAVWGTLEAEQALVAPDRSTIKVPAPTKIDGDTITGEGYTLKLAPGWVVRPGKRTGDFDVVQSEAGFWLFTSSSPGDHRSRAP